MSLKETKVVLKISLCVRSIRVSNYEPLAWFMIKVYTVNACECCVVSVGLVCVVLIRNNL